MIVLVVIIVWGNASLDQFLFKSLLKAQILLKCLIDFIDALLILNILDHGWGTACSISVVLHHDVLDLWYNWHFLQHAWLWDGAQRVGTVPCALESVYAQAEFAHHAANFIVLTFVQFHVQPSVSVLSVFNLNMVGTVLSIIHNNAITKLLQFLFIKSPSKHTNPIRTLHRIMWHFKCLCQFTIISNNE